MAILMVRVSSPKADPQSNMGTPLKELGKDLGQRQFGGLVVFKTKHRVSMQIVLKL